MAPLLSSLESGARPIVLVGRSGIRFLFTPDHLGYHARLIDKPKGLCASAIADPRLSIQVQIVSAQVESSDFAHFRLPGKC